MDRDDTAAVLGLPPEKVRVIPTATGGGFANPTLTIVALAYRPGKFVNAALDKASMQIDDVARSEGVVAKPQREAVVDTPGLLALDRRFASD